MKTIVAAVAAVLVWTAGVLPAAAQSAPTLAPRFPAAQDDGGVRVVTGQVGSENFAFLPELYPNPVVLLIDVSNVIPQPTADFIPESGQILGVFTTPLFPGPGEARVNLPIEPTGKAIDLDNDGEDDAGVQIYALQYASNLVLDSYLQQMEQQSGGVSYLSDVVTGAVTEGTFLVYAPDNAQGFPEGWGDDGLWFTADDPTQTLAAGYTVVTLGPDGAVTADRSPVGVINTMERAEAKALDFSNQGILESFNSLIDALMERYAYTELRGLDWDKMRAQFLPDVTAADADQDMAAYFLVLDTLAQSLEDTHVQATAKDPAIAATKAQQLSQVAATVGAATLAVSDESGAIGDRIFVVAVGDGSPAADAGWLAGTEIISIDGTPAAERLAEVPLIMGLGTAEGRRVAQARSILRFPEGQTVTVGYRLPEASTVQTVTLTAGDYSEGPSRTSAESAKPISYVQQGDYAIVRWSDFMGYIVPKIAVLEEALALEGSRGTNGVIVDLRGNGGGWVTLYETMASYFFSERNPMPARVFDYRRYDADAGTHITSFFPDYKLSAPRAELAFSGPVVVLVDELCASACEYFTQHLSLLDRATVIGQYATAGAGGFIDRIAMPGQIEFQFTQGGTYFAGTDEPNLEAKGVVPDIRVPVTVDNELAKLTGADPVLEAAVQYLDENQPDRLTQNAWVLTSYINRSRQQIDVPQDDAVRLTFADDGTLAVSADCAEVAGTYERGEFDALTITLNDAGATTCADDSPAALLLSALPQIIGVGYDGSNLALLNGQAGDVLGFALAPAE